MWHEKLGVKKDFHEFSYGGLVGSEKFRVYTCHTQTDVDDQHGGFIGIENARLVIDSPWREFPIIPLINPQQ